MACAAAGRKNERMGVNDACLQLSQWIKTTRNQNNTKANFTLL